MQQKAQLDGVHVTGNVAELRKSYPVRVVSPEGPFKSVQQSDRSAGGLRYFLAGFAATLHRYTGQELITLHAHCAGRAEGAPLLLNVQVASDMRLDELLRGAGELLKQLPSGNLDSSEVRFAAPPELHNELASLPPVSAADMDLQLVVSQAAQGVVVNVECRRDRFEDWFIAQFARHVEVLIRELAANREAVVSDVQLLTDEERRRIVEEWNDTARPNSDAAIPELFVAQVKKNPDRTAIIHGRDQLTYRQLNERANRLAHYLGKRGVGPEVFVGFCFDNSIEAIVAVLGILKCGGAYIPLDPSHPLRRLREIVDHDGIRIILTHSKTRKSVPAGIGLIVDLDEAAAEIAQESDADSSSGCTADSAAYVIHTSGSAGQPKAVIGIHRSVVNGLHETLFDRNGNDEVNCLGGSLTIGFQILGLFLPLLSGVPLVILSITQYRDPLLLADAVNRYKITSLVLPTPSLRQLLGLGVRATSRLQTIRTFMVGGSLVTPDLVEGVARTFPNARLYKAYGSTEIGGIATKGIARVGNSVGKPIANTSVYILDKHKKLVPIGVAGELYVGGAHFARGYLNEPDLTAAYFMKNPFAERPGERLFRTGDLARYRSDGEVEFLGRMDDQVKIRGFRVQPGEIEAVLSGHERVREATVWVRDFEGQQQLVAYVVANPPGLPTVSELRDFIGKRLPEYMIPSAFVFLERLPMTSSGKVDRSALPQPAPLRPAVDSQYAPPSNEVEAFLVEVWKGLLKLDRIGIHDDFLDLGGDSLFAVQVTSQIWERYAFEMPVELMFERRTIAALAGEIISASGATQTS